MANCRLEASILDELDRRLYTGGYSANPRRPRAQSHFSSPGSSAVSTTTRSCNGPPTCRTTNWGAGFCHNVCPPSLGHIKAAGATTVRGLEAPGGIVCDVPRAQDGGQDSVGDVARCLSRPHGGKFLFGDRTRQSLVPKLVRLRSFWCRAAALLLLLLPSAHAPQPKHC